MDTIGRMLNNDPAVILNKAAIRLRKPIQKKKPSTHAVTPFAIKKFSDVNHIIQAVNPNTPPNIVANNPPIKDTDTYKNTAAPMIYMKKGKMNKLANMSRARKKISVTVTRMILTQKKNSMTPITPNPRPPEAINGVAIMKKGRKFQRYYKGKVTIKSGSTPKFWKNNSAGVK